MSVCFIKRKFAAWSLALTLAVLASLLITSFVFAESEDLPAAPEENEPAAAESEPAAPVEQPSEPAAPVEETPVEAEVESPQDEVVVPVVEIETGPVDETEAVVNPAEEPGEEAVSPAIEAPVVDLGSIILPPAEAVENETCSESIADAAQLTSGGDPYWYVGTKKYAVVTNISLCPADAYQCWVSTTPIQKALDKIEDESLLPTDKKLYVLAGIYTEDISFEGELLSKMNGLIGVDGSTNTIINGDIYIPFNTGGFTLSGFTINGGVEVTDSTGNLVFSDLVVTNTNGDGIHVTGGTEEFSDEYDEWEETMPHPGTVTLDHVNSSGNHGAGAYILAKNTIKVTNSTFNYNNIDVDYPEAGLYLDNWWGSGYKIELNNVTANQNQGDGIDLWAGSAVIQNVIANGNVHYYDDYDESYYGGSGIFASVPNSLVFNTITALSNDGSGIISLSKVATLKNIIANNNDGTGVYANSWRLTTLALENITANNNGEYGIYAAGRYGASTAITLKNIVANGNDYSGILVNNQNSGAVTITNTTTNENTQNGVFIISGGTVKLTTIRSSQNTGFGLHIRGYEIWKYWEYFDEELEEWVEEEIFMGLASPLITLTSPADANFVNVFNNNGGLGIYIRSDKPVVITNFKANNNASSGLEVEGMCKWDEDAGSYVDCHPSGALTIKSTITGFNNTLDGNGYIGIEVADANGAVIIERTQVTNGHNMGIYINTLGAITLKDVESNNNRESGLVLFNNGAPKAVPITLTNVEASGSLEYNGIFARSKGAITLNNVIANHNNWSGADLDNCLLDDGSGLCLGTGAITITNSSGKLNTFNNNGRFGVWAQSKGAITVTNIQANNNGSDGAAFYNNVPGSSANITIGVSGILRNEFNGNGTNGSYDPGVDNEYEHDVRFNGLSMRSFGNISIKNSEAKNNQNQGGGIVFGNYESATPKTVLVSDCEVSGNDWHGLFVYSKGNITLTNISADTNHISGVFADNCLYDDGSGTCGGTGTVTLTNITSNNNWSRGIEVYSKGVISLTNINALHNTGNEGVFLENRYTGSIANVTLKTVTANGNNNSGVLIMTNGSVIMSNITANNNHCMQGWLLDEDKQNTAQDWYNAEQGDDRWSFYLEAGTPYTISMLGSGVDFTNLSSFVAMMKLYDESAPETLINSGQTINFTPGTSGWYYVLVNNNDGTDGMYRISLAGENTPDPGSPDMMFWVDGVAVVAGGNVTLKSGTFVDNSVSGLYVSTNGNIIVSNVDGSLNGTDGFDLYNNGNITLSGNNLANDNGWHGLHVETNGILSLTNLEASNNGQFGIDIHAEGAGKAVTLKGITVMDNLLDGLNISANGKLTLNDIRSWLNGGSGAVLDTHGYALLVQSSVFMCNGEYGLEYKDYALPFTFINTSNVYFGNTSGATHKN